MMTLKSLPSSMDRKPQATPFMLGINPQRLTPEAIRKQWYVWQERLAMPYRVRVAYAKNVRVRWNLHTNALEGNALSHQDTALVLLVGRTNPRLKVRDIEEMRGHDAAVTHVRRWVDTERPLTRDALLTWHHLLMVRDREITEQTPEGEVVPVGTIHAGQYKDAYNYVYRPDGSTYYFAPPDEVPVRMDHLLRHLENALPRIAARPPAMDVPELLAWQHAEFINIHPFDDGNGRLGRLINSWLCLKAGFPVSIIPVTARTIYLEAMAECNEGDPRSLRDLLAATLVKEMDFGLAVARGESDPSLRNEEADPKRPPQPPPDIEVNGWD